MGQTYVTTRLLRTLWLFWAFVYVGFCNGSLGPTLLDLQKILQVDAAKMNNILLLQGFGFIVGTLLGTPLGKVFNMNLIMTVFLLLGSLANITIPWMTSYPVMLLLFSIQGLSKGFVDFACMLMCNLMWPDASGLPFQFITIGAGLSSFFSPLIAWPFINSGSPEDAGLSYQQRQLFNYPSEYRACADVNGTNLCPAEETQVQIPYLIMGLLTLPPVVAFMYFYVKEKLIDVSSYDVLPSEPRFRGETRKIRILFAILLFCFHIPIFGTILAYGDLLVLFGVKGPLDIVMKQMMYMTSVFWGSFLIGRIVACCCSNYIGQFTLMLLNFVGLLAICILLITVGDIYVPALWIGSSALGFFSAPYLPGAMAWASEFITMDGTIIGMCLAASGVGELLIPYIAATLFNTQGAMSLMYTVFGLTVYQILLFTVMTVVRSSLVKD